MDYARDADIKVVIARRLLQGSNRPAKSGHCFYIDGEEYRVYAPPQGGDALEWVPH